MISVLMKGGVNTKANDHDDKDDYVSSSPEAVSTSSSDNDDYDDDSTSTYSSDGSKKKMSGNNDDNHNNVDIDTAQQLAATPTVVVNESLTNMYVTNSNVDAQYHEHDKKVEDEEQDGILIIQQEEDDVEEDSYVVISSLYKRCSTETKPPLKMIATKRSTTSSLYEDLPRPTRSAYSPSSSSSSNKFDIWRKEELFNFKSFYNDLYGGGGSISKQEEVKLV